MTNQATTASGQSFGWLHLTDLHVGMVNQDWLWPAVKNALFEDLDKVHQLAGDWDLVIFSGDLVQSGEKSEYEKLNVILSDIWERFAKLGCAPELIVLPRNHDLKRPSMNSAYRTLRRWWDEEDVQVEFFANKGNEYRLATEKMFEEYSRWVSETAGVRFGLRKGVNGLLPGDQSHLIEKNGFKIGIAALNSTWLQINDDDFEGQLHVDTRQLLEITGGDPDQWCSLNDLNLLVTHHPADWLHPQSLEYWQNDINPAGRFAAHIFGHVHQASAKLGALGGSVARVELQGISTFGLAKIAGKIDRSHGYSAVRFQAENTGSLQIWPRKLYKAQGGGYNIGSENSFKLGLDQSFTITLNLSATASTNQAEPQSLSEIPHVGSIQASLSELEVTFQAAPAHANVRTVEQKLTIDALNKLRACWIVAEWGLGEDGFLSTIKAKLSPATPAYKLDLSEFKDRGQLSDHLKQSFGFNFERLCQLLSESGASLLVLDNVALKRSAPDSSADDELEQLVNVALEYCPAIHVVLRSHRIPTSSSFSTIQIGTLDEADLRNYVSDHPDGQAVYETQAAIDQLHRYTEGIPSRIDQALRELQVVSLAELVSSDVDFADSNPATLRGLDSLVTAIRTLSEGTDTTTQKEFGLLKVLALFPQGESLGRIERFYSTSKFYPSFAANLRAKGLIEVVTQQVLRIGAINEPEKKLRIGLPVRECVRDLLKDEEPYELNRRAAEIYFGPSWHSGQFKPPRSYRFDTPHCPPGDIINANTILVRLLKEAIRFGKKNNIDRVLGLCENYIRALSRGDHYASAAALCADLLPLIPNHGFEEKSALLTAEYAGALRMSGRHNEAKDVIDCILDYDFSTSKRQSVLIDLAYCHESLSETDDARAVAKELIELDEHSGYALHAEALLIESEKDDPERIEKLKALERRARKEGATVAAGNIALHLASHAGNNPDEVRNILAPLINSKSSSDHYNRIRAIVRMSRLSLKNGRSLTESERGQLVRAYHFVFNEQMPALFDQCHQALWQDFMERGDLANLLILFRHSSLRWRLRGQVDKEQRYLEELAVAASDLLEEVATRVEKELAYFQVRETYYGQDG
jgi:Calcineurin-like phosphoesterase